MLVSCLGNRNELNSMYLLRLLFWFLIGWLIYRYVRQSLPTSPPPADSAKSQRGAGKSPHVIEQMVKCHVCELHIPQTEAIADRGRYYCCEDHRRRDQ